MRTTAATRWSVGRSARILPFSLKSIVIAFGMALDVASPSCAETPPFERATDDVLALRVQAAIASDPALKPHNLNLLVNVLDGMAVIGGEVPSIKLLSQIEDVAKAVPGIRSVKVSGWESSKTGRDDPFTKRVIEQVTPAPVPPAVTPPQPALPPLTIKPMEDDSRGKMIRKPIGPESILLDPVVASSPGKIKPLAPGAAPLPYETIPPTSVPTKPVESEDWQAVPSAQDWQIARDRDQRFAALQVRRNGKQYTIFGTAARITDAWDFADVLRELPGVDAVIVGRVERR